MKIWYRLGAVQSWDGKWHSFLRECRKGCGPNGETITKKMALLPVEGETKFGSRREALDAAKVARRKLELTSKPSGQIS